VDFSKVDLPTAGANGDETASFSNSDIAAIGLQARRASDLGGAHVSAAGAKLCVTGNNAGLNVPAGSVGVDVTRNVSQEDVTALGFNFCSRLITGIGLHARRANPTRTDISSLGHKGHAAGQVCGFNVAAARVDVDAEGVGYCDYNLYPELHIPACRHVSNGWRVHTRKCAGNENAVQRFACGQGVFLE
jgi:hypothetical protein